MWDALHTRRREGGERAPRVPLDGIPEKARWWWWGADSTKKKLIKK